MTATSSERPVFFPAGPDTLFGVLTAPVSQSNGLCVVMLHGGGYTVSSHLNGTTARLCRDLAALGYHSFRFTYHGVENSTGRLEEARLDEPFTADLTGAVEWLAEAGLDRLVLVGSCFGARTALSFAEHHPSVAALVLEAPSPIDMSRSDGTARRLAMEVGLGGYLQRAARAVISGKAFDARRLRRYLRFARFKLLSILRRLTGRWGKTGRPDPFGPSRRFLRPLEQLVGRRVPVFFLYGTRDWFGIQFGKALGGELGELVDGSDGLIESVQIEGNVHGLTTVVTQEKVRTLVVEWLARRVADGSIRAGGE